MVMKFYTDEMIEFLKNNAHGTPTKDLTKMFNRHFRCEVSESAITNQLHKYQIKIGVNSGCFSKGSTPFNKGKKWVDYLSKESQEKILKTCFKKNDHSFQNANHNEREMYSERIDAKDGYIYTKVGTNKRALKHQYIYEQNFGKIPKGYACIFLDGNKYNFEPNNLAIVTKEENLYLNRHKLRFNDKDLTKSGVNIAKLMVKINERKKK